MPYINLLDINGSPFKPKEGANITFDNIYPVGSIYLNTRLVEPAQLFGGTWNRIQSTFLLAAGNTYSAGSTGGASSRSYTPVGSVDDHTLTTAELPSHNHTFTGKAKSSGNQSAGHTHKFTDYYATTTGGTKVTTAQITSHGHSYHASQRNVWSNSVGLARITVYVSGDGSRLVSNTKGGRNYSQNSCSSNSHNHGGPNSSSSRTSGGISANHTHKATLAGSIGNTGGGGAHNHGFTGTAAAISTMPPYVAVYGWVRTA